MYIYIYVCVCVCITSNHDRVYIGIGSTGQMCNFHAIQGTIFFFANVSGYESDTQNNCQHEVSGGN